MSVINNNNNVPICVGVFSCELVYLAVYFQWLAMMSTYTDEAEPIFMWWVEDTYG